MTAQAADAALAASTHDVQIGRTLVSKRFKSWSRDEPRREWTALGLLQEHAPDLAPQPVRAGLDDTPPSVTMRRLPGVPLGLAPLDSHQLDAQMAAIERLHSAVPAGVLEALPPRVWPARDLLTAVRDWIAQGPSAGDDSTVRAALAGAAAWTARPAQDRLVATEGVAVLGRADGNLANDIWDGTVVRLVDFEDSGRSDRAYELADVVEHLSTTATGISASEFLDRTDLGPAEAGLVHGHRRLFATFWLLMLLPGGPAAGRNPPEALGRQADRVLALLG